MVVSILYSFVPGESLDKVLNGRFSVARPDDGQNIKSAWEPLDTSARQVMAGRTKELPLLGGPHRFRRFGEVVRGSRLDLDEDEDTLIDGDEVDFT